jgi:hypothetical protein
LRRRRKEEEEEENMYLPVLKITSGYQPDDTRPKNSWPPRCKKKTV